MRRDEKRTKRESKIVRYGYRLIRRYGIWLILLLGTDVFGVMLLWLADLQALGRMIVVLVLFTLLLFTVVCFVLTLNDRKRERAFAEFLDNPDEYHEKLLAEAVNFSDRDRIHLLGETLREEQYAYRQLQAGLDDYEEYVEGWAHEIKTPLSLLTLLLDNRGEELHGTVKLKLEYIRNSMQESVDQMLYYARLKSARKDYLFEHIRVCACIEEVLEDYRPLLEEKQFQIQLPKEDGEIYTDRRGMRFLLGQIVSNAVKYSGREPVLTFTFTRKKQAYILKIQDNGRGVRDCDLPYIFEKGFTGDSGGDRKKATGMGLYLAKGIAEEMNLTLKAESRWGEGFEMQIEIPIV